MFVKTKCENCKMSKQIIQNIIHKNNLPPAIRSHSVDSLGENLLNRPFWVLFWSAVENRVNVYHHPEGWGATSIDPERWYTQGHLFVQLEGLLGKSIMKAHSPSGHVWRAVTSKYNLRSRW